MPSDIRYLSDRVEILTCSTAGDIDLFAPLAASIDRYVDPAVRHRVVVPSVDMKRFAAFASVRREILAQEGVLPKLWKLPSALGALPSLRGGLHRPVYLTARRQVVRGWMLQQLLKIEMTRRSDAMAIMHVDSDVCFVRPFRAEDAFDEGKVTFFRTEGDTGNPQHQKWVQRACTMLGANVLEGHKAHYVENCVLWSRDVTQTMVERVETVQGRPLADVIFATDSMSEYYLYGLFADFFPDQAPLARQEVSYCNSFWPDNSGVPVPEEYFLNRLKPKHCAIAVQSTHKISLEDRLALYQSLDQAIT